MMRRVTILFLWLLVATTAFSDDFKVFPTEPSKVSLGTHVYSISYVKDPFHNPNLDGICSYSLLPLPDPFSITHKIEVRRSLSKDDRDSTLIHELLYVSAHEADVFLSEEDVGRLETTLFKMLKKNKWQILVNK